MGNAPSKKISRTKSKEPTPLRQEAHEESTVDGPVHAGRLALPEVQAQAREREREREIKGKGKEQLPPSTSQSSVQNGDAQQPAAPAPGEAVPMGVNEVSTLSLIRSGPSRRSGVVVEERGGGKVGTPPSERSPSIRTTSNTSRLAGGRARWVASGKHPPSCLCRDKWAGPQRARTRGQSRGGAS